MFHYFKSEKKGDIKKRDDIYIGRFLNDRRNGYGAYKSMNGTIYKGDFVNN